MRREWQWFVDVGGGQDNEMCAVLGFSVASTGCPETSVRNYPSALPRIIRQSA